MSDPVTVAVAVPLGSQDLDCLGEVDFPLQVRRVSDLPRARDLQGCEVLYADDWHESVWRAPELQWIHCFRTGLDHLPNPPRDSSVTLTNSRGVLADTVAAHACSLMLVLMRGLLRAFRAQADRRWLHWQTDEFPCRDLRGLQAGVIGFGPVGQHIAQLLLSLGLHVEAVNRSGREPRPERDVRTSHPSVSNGEHGVTLRSLGEVDDVIRSSDVLQIALPLTSRTRGFLSRSRLSLMKPDAVLINVSRGQIVNEQALVEALTLGKIAGAGLDVFEDEPLSVDSPLWTLPNVLITPHVAGVSDRIGQRNVRFFLRNLECYVRGRPLQNVVSLDAFWP